MTVSWVASPVSMFRTGTPPSSTGIVLTSSASGRALSIFSKFVRCSITSPPMSSGALRIICLSASFCCWLMAVSFKLGATMLLPPEPCVNAILGILTIRQMNIEGVDLNLLGPLAALLEERHVSRAAGRQHMSQPAMSRALRELRAVFDDELLVRRAGADQLTPTRRTAPA